MDTNATTDRNPAGAWRTIALPLSWVALGYLAHFLVVPILLMARPPEGPGPVGDETLALVWLIAWPFLFCWIWLSAKERAGTALTLAWLTTMGLALMPESLFGNAWWPSVWTSLIVHFLPALVTLIAVRWQWRSTVIFASGAGIAFMVLKPEVSMLVRLVTDALAA